ncbi:MAG: DNA recombination protein RmuC, partial [Lachnospiraceae bacterium]|nr:DNA recombination protein RmuC [Lachnospiraceae bacterium]
MPLEKYVYIIFGVLLLLLIVLFVVILVKLISGKRDGSLDVLKAMNDIENNIIKDNKDNFIQMLDKNNNNATEILKTLQEKLDAIRDTNERKLVSIEQNINEKLDKSLNERMDKSFKIIGEQFQNLNKNIGELQSLSSGVSDLQKTLSNVKTRGVFGEKQLENILENILGTSNQWEKQYRIRDDENRKVDFAIKIPNKDDDSDLYLPIDAKFPSDMYNKIVEASNNGTDDDVKNAVKELKQAITKQAMSIRDKYICPPTTTDFALM